MLTQDCWADGKLRAYSASSYCCSQTYICFRLPTRPKPRNRIWQRQVVAAVVGGGAFPRTHLTTGWHGETPNRKGPLESNSQQRAQIGLHRHMMAQPASKSSPTASRTSLWGRVGTDFLRSLACWKVLSVSCFRAGRDWVNSQSVPWKGVISFGYAALGQWQSKSLTKTPPRMVRWEEVRRCEWTSLETEQVFLNSTSRRNRVTLM